VLTLQSYVPPKRRLTKYLHGAISQNTAFFIVTTVKTSNFIIFFVDNIARTITNQLDIKNKKVEASVPRLSVSVYITPARSLLKHPPVMFHTDTVTDIAVELLAILLRTVEVLVTNIDQEISDPKIFLITFSQMLGWYLILGPGRFLSHSFQFSIH
jgi:hypothetical protein